MKVHTKTVWQMLPEGGFELLEDEFYGWDGPVAEAGSGGGGTNTITESGPPKFQIPYIERVLQSAANQYDQGPLPYYPGNTVVPLNTQQKTGLEQARQFGQGGAQDVADQSQAAFTFGLNAADPTQNPYFAKTATALVRPLERSLTQQILPQIDSGAIQSGQFGGSRQGLAQGQAVGAFTEAAGDALARFGSNAYAQGLNTFSNTLAQAPQVQQTGLAPSQIISGVGDTINAQGQTVLQSNVDRFNYNVNAPGDALATFAGLVGNPLGSSSSQQRDGARTSRLTSGLGGAAVGAAAGGALGSAASGVATSIFGSAVNGAATGSSFGAWGTAIGAVAGLLYGALA